MPFLTHEEHDAKRIVALETPKRTFPTSVHDLRHGAGRAPRRNLANLPNILMPTIFEATPELVYPSEPSMLPLIKTFTTSDDHPLSLHRACPLESVLRTMQSLVEQQTLCILTLIEQQNAAVLQLIKANNASNLVVMMEMIDASNKKATAMLLEALLHKDTPMPYSHPPQSMTDVHAFAPVFSQPSFSQSTSQATIPSPPLTYLPDPNPMPNSCPPATPSPPVAPPTPTVHLAQPKSQTSFDPAMVPINPSFASAIATLSSATMHFTPPPPVPRFSTTLVFTVPVIHDLLYINSNISTILALTILHSICHCPPLGIAPTGFHARHQQKHLYNVCPDHPT
jgi:hypothetical protein